VLAKYNIKERLIQKSQSPFVRSLGVYTLLNFFLKGISFIITPLFTNYISPSEFGNLNLYLNSINLISPFIILSTNSISVDYFKNDKKELSKQISTYFLFSFGISLFIALLICIFHTFLTEYFKFSFIYILLVPFICFFNLIIDTGFIFFRNENMLKKITALTIFRTILEIGLSVFLIMFMIRGAEGRIISMLASTTVVFVISYIFVYHFSELKLTFNIDYIRKEYRFWFSTSVGFLFVLSFTVFDKYIVKYFCTADELGQYGLATQFGFIILTFSAALNSAFHPQLYRNLADNLSLDRIKEKLFLLILTIVFVSIGSAGIIYFLYKFIINQQYAKSWHIIYLVTISYGLWSIISLLNGFLNYYKMKKLNFYLGLFSIFIFIPFEIMGVKLLKINGLVYTQIIYFLIIIFVIVIKIRAKIHVSKVKF
jgi:O-antigen/teichoic acid export membrane protein